jgi:hypothetical protein
MERKPHLETLLDELRRSTESLLHDLEHAKREGSTLAEELRVVRLQMETMANLYVQLRRVHSSLRLDEVVDAIEESLINLIGSEDFALFLRNGEGRFELLHAMGAGHSLAPFADGEGPLGAAVAAGRLVYGNPTAAVPLRSALDAGGCMGLLAVVGLLPHKAALIDVDRALLEVLAEHAGVALEAALCAVKGQARAQVSELRAQLAARPARPPLRLEP